MSLILKKTIMKKFRKISLSQMNLNALTKKQQQLIFGGQACKCGSCSESTNSYTNLDYNYASGITGTGTNDPICRCSTVGGEVYSIAAV